MMADSIQACRPRFGILENVDEMSRPEEDSDNVHCLNEKFRGMGYAVAATTMNSLFHGAAEALEGAVLNHGSSSVWLGVARGRELLGSSVGAREKLWRHPRQVG